MLRTRLLTAALLAPIVVIVAWLGEPWLSLLVGLVIFLALVEVIGLLDAAGFEPPQVVMLAAGIAVAGAAIIAANQGFVGALLSSLLAATSLRMDARLPFDAAPPVSTTRWTGFCGNPDAARTTFSQAWPKRCGCDGRLSDRLCAAGPTRGNGPGSLRVSPGRRVTWRVPE